MTFHTIRDISPPGPVELVCRQSRLMNWVPVMSLVALLGGSALLPVDGGIFWWVIWGMRLFMLLCLLAFAAALRKSYGTENWLLRIYPRSQSLWIKFRSYHNEHFSDDDEVIVQLRNEEIAWVGLMREHWLRPGDEENAATSQCCTFVDIGLREGVDVEMLRQKLDEERRREPRGRYVKTKYKDYPVRLVDGPVIRLSWRSSAAFVVPSPKRLLREVSRFAEVRKQRQKFLDTATPAAEKQAMEAQIIELVERGNTIAATRLVRRRYGCPLTDAKQMVDELCEPKRPT